jgi:hypothetical protein
MASSEMALFAEALSLRFDHEEASFLRFNHAEALFLRFDNIFVITRFDN